MLSSSLRRWLSVCASGGLLSAGACGGAGIEPSVPTTVTPSVTAVAFTALGQSRQLSAAVLDQRGDSVPSPTLAWTTSNPAVVSVNDAGLVTAVGPGTAEVTVTTGSVSATIAASVVQVAAEIRAVDGDGQTTPVGQPAPQPLTAEVVDSNAVPIAGASVSFTLPADAGTVGTPSGVTGPDGRISTSVTLSAVGTASVTAAVGGTSLSVQFRVTATSLFQIEVQFTSPVDSAQQAAFTAAQHRWESIIVGDVPDVLVDALAGTCGDNSPELVRSVDDVVILATLEPIDGPGGVLGEAGPCYVRNGSLLPIVGMMRFDDADLDLLESAGILQGVILHEMGHVLGFGTIWPGLGLLADPAESGGVDPHFTGSQAIGAFDQIGGSTYSGAKVPVEDSGGPETVDSHWRESVFGRELMTGFVQPGLSPLSRVTIASMSDMGFSVSFATADSYTLSSAIMAFGARPARPLGRDIARLPLKVVDRSGRVVETLQR